MDVKHPKRKKDKQNPYTLSIENGKEYISFHDTEGTYRKIEVTHVLFSQFNDFELEDISYLILILNKSI